MEPQKLAEAVKKIEMPKEMQERIMQNCYMEMEEKTMKKSTGKHLFRKPMVVAAACACCLCVTGATALAATGKLQGFFKDVTGLFGVVKGTSYEQATDEIEMRVIEVSDMLTVDVTMINPAIAPYSEIETIEFGTYKIVAMDGNVVTEGKISNVAPVVDGKAIISIALEDASAGTYQLLISELVGKAKAEQPLTIRGEWECEFTR